MDDESDEWRSFAEEASSKYLSNFHSFNEELDKANESCASKRNKPEEYERCLLFVQRDLFKFLSKVELAEKDLESCWKKADHLIDEKNKCGVKYEEELNKILIDSIRNLKK